MAYSPVHVTNSTAYDAAGAVDYASAFCSDDTYTASANGGDWTAGGRGVCLVTKVTATLFVNGGKVDALPYTSSGTSYSQFAVIQTSTAPSFAVTRVTDALESTDVGELEAEPTEQQK